MDAADFTREASSPAGFFARPAESAAPMQPRAKKQPEHIRLLFARNDPGSVPAELLLGNVLPGFRTK
jgi:hypothetical protein